MADVLVGGMKSATDNLGGTGYNVIDLLFVMVAKRTTEIGLMPTIGNSTWKSAIVKGVGATVLYMVGNSQQGLIRKGAHIVSAGMALDAMEDASIALLGENPMQEIGGTLGGILGKGKSAASQSTNASSIISVDV